MARTPGISHQLWWILVLVAFCTACAEDEAAPPVATAPAVGDMSDREAQARAEGLLLKKFDLNRDQQPDVFKFYREEADPQNPGNKLERLVRKELDINHDGKVDIIRVYDAQQVVIEEKTDLDFDGRIDTVTFFKDGVKHHSEIDVNYDTKADVTKFYEEGKLARVESDRDNDGKVDTWEYYVNGELDRVGTDSDKDGMADSWERKRQLEADEPASEPGTAPGAETAPKPDADAGAEEES